MSNTVDSTGAPPPHFAVRTPHYVLMDAKHRIGPDVVDAACETIYGFSDRPPYNVFCAKSQLRLKPYPLVKGYLRDKIDLADGRLMLVVLDATGPRDPSLLAATVDEVLAAHEQHATYVDATYELTLDEATDVYRVQAATITGEPNKLSSG